MGAEQLDLDALPDEHACPWAHCNPCPKMEQERAELIAELRACRAERDDAVREISSLMNYGEGHERALLRARAERAEADRDGALGMLAIERDERNDYLCKLEDAEARIAAALEFHVKRDTGYCRCGGVWPCWDRRALTGGDR